MGQVHLTPEQAQALAKLPKFEGMMTLTHVYQQRPEQPPEHLKIMVAQGSYITAEYTISTLGAVEEVTV